MRISTAQRRARLGVRHRLARKAASVEEAARAVVALHATDPATVFLSAGARLTAPGPEPVERALYEERTLTRMTGMRRTMFVVPADLVPVVQHSSTRAIAVRERRSLVKVLTENGRDEAWLDDVAGSVRSNRSSPATCNETRISPAGERRWQWSTPRPDASTTLAVSSTPSPPTTLPTVASTTPGPP